MNECAHKKVDARNRTFDPGPYGLIGGWGIAIEDRSEPWPHPVG